jgi:hypothetical protein
VTSTGSRRGGSNGDGCGFNRDETDPFACFLAFNEPFLGGGTPAAAEQVAAAKSGISAPATDEVAAAITAVVAAVAEGGEMPDGVSVPREPAGGTTVSSAGAGTGEAAPAAAAAAAAAATAAAAAAAKT